MTYHPGSRIEPTLAENEKRLLDEGLNYSEIAGILGVRHLSVAARNQLVYKINLIDKFADRIDREGIENRSRLDVTDAFGYWFSGLFDGEGCLVAHVRKQCNGYDRQLAIKITLRDDDLPVLERVKENLGTGRICHRVGKGKSNPSSTLTIQKIADLTEIIVPLFDKFPLWTKKGREFVIWKKMVIDQYKHALGGYSQRLKATPGYEETFMADLLRLREIRSYKRPPGNRRDRA